jgi:hypothetical protein
MKKLIWFVFLGVQSYLSKAQVDSSKIKSSPDKNKIEGIDTVHIRSESNLVTLGDDHLYFSEKQLSSIILPNSLSDPIQFLKFLPGISNSQEMNSGLYVRGGTAHSTSIYWNDVPIPNLSHSFGLLSIFNTNTVGSIDYFNSTVSGFYGNRGASYFKFSGRSHEFEKLKVDLNFNLISSDIFMSVPLVKRKLVFSTSLRKSILSSVYNNNIVPVFSDFLDHFSQLHWSINSKNSLTAAIIQISDNRSPIEFDGLIDFKDSNKYNFQSISFRHENKISNSLKWTNLFFTNSFINSFYSKSYDFLSMDSKQSEENFKSVLSINIFRTIQRLGIEWSRSNLVNKTKEFNDSIRRVQQITCLSGFWDIQYQSARWAIDANGRITYCKNGASIIYPEFRLGTKYLLNNKFNLYSNFNTFLNFKHVLSANLLSSSQDYTFYSNESILPSLTQEGIVGINWKTSKINLKSNVYYRRMNNIMDFVDLYSNNFYFNSNIKSGIGRSVGLESILSSRISKNLELFISYTLNQTKVKNDFIDGGSWYSPNWDRPQILHITLSQNMSKGKWIVNFDLQSGRPITRPLFLAFFTGVGTPVYSKRNSFRLPLYHRMDLGYQFKPIRSKRFTQLLGVYIYNIYLHQNVYSMMFVYDYVERGYKSHYITAFPFLPTMNYKISLN